jgi:hypothetical protein
VATPVSHLKRLEAGLSTHESWLTTLRRQIEGLEAEASAHEMMLRLGRDPETALDNGRRSPRLLGRKP